eukprot:TRINITY_DN11563_c0_g1_i1.p1 TRINITY_DN11563_c0_g1~~TRINITY_DN11563_c0_g1_i1.p1  ORF type:complete len:607 (+),score=89.43 TRINITY_DN11563_c0_g1_i1:118-1938(+)
MGAACGRDAADCKVNVCGTKEARAEEIEIWRKRVDMQISESVPMRACFAPSNLGDELAANSRLPHGADFCPFEMECVEDDLNCWCRRLDEHVPERLAMRVCFPPSNQAKPALANEGVGTAHDVVPSEFVVERCVEEWPGMGLLQPENIDFWELTQGRPPLRLPRVEQRGVTLTEMRALLGFVKRRCDKRGAIRGWYDPHTGAQLYYQSLTVLQLVHWVVKPLTSRAGCSVAEILTAREESGDPASRVPPEWFVCHWWKEPFVVFVRRVRNHARAEGLAVDASYWSPFLATRLYECSGLTVSSEAGKGIASRLELEWLRIHFSDCTGKLSAADELGCGLAALPALCRLELNFAGCSELHAVGRLGQGLAALQALHELELNFAGATALATVEDLSWGLSAMRMLVVLKVDLSACPNLADVSILGASIGSLEHIAKVELKLARCLGLTSVDGLGAGICKAKSLTSLSLKVDGCAALCDVAGFGRSLADLRNLEYLELSFSGCTQLSAVGDVGEAIANMKLLAELDISVVGCSQLASIESLGRSIGVLPALRHLRLGLSGCVALSSSCELLSGLSRLQECRPAPACEVSLVGCNGLSPRERELILQASGA